MSFLSEAVVFSDHTSVSPFQKCITVVTICGRAMAHHQQSKAECVYKNLCEDFWNRHQWLETLLTQQESILSLEYPSASEHVDPTILFIDMMVHATVLYLYKTVEFMPWNSEEYQEIMLECQQRALTAAVSMIALTKSLSQLSCFKVNLKSSLSFSAHDLSLRYEQNFPLFPHSRPPFIKSPLTHLIPTSIRLTESQIKNNRSTLSHPSSYFYAQNSSLATRKSMNPWETRPRRYWMYSGS